MELTESQNIILAAQEDKIAVRACAAALKTATLIEKTRQLLRAGVEPSSIAVITFTNLASQECVDRLGSDYKEGIFVGTIHSLAAHILVKNGLGAKVGKAAATEDFDKLFDLCKPLYVTGLYDWILLDEAQDCGKNELTFIFDMLKPPHFFVAFDERQTIYEFKGSSPELLLKYLNKEATFYTLNENFRNDKDILDFARSIIKKTGAFDTSTCMSKYHGNVYDMKYDINWLRDQIYTYDDFKDWAFLCRTNAQVEKICTDLEQYGIPTATFKQGDLTKAQLDRLMCEDSVKVLTAHSSKGLAWNNVIAFNMNFWNDEELRLGYVAATRAKHRLYWVNDRPEKKKKKKGF